MANNRLYIQDTETGDRFLLCKSLGMGWYVWSGFDPDKLTEWMDGRDEIAESRCYATRLRLVTEYELIT